MFDWHTEEIAERFQAEIKRYWGKLTDSEVRLYNGRRNMFFDKVAEKYGLSREEAQRCLADIEESFCWDIEKTA